MGIMAIGRIIILSTLVAQALSAPSGCIESCNFFQTSSTHQTSGGYQDHASLVQGRTNVNDYDYAKPGNWTEHNQYKTDDGHGKVHEERGQYVEGSKKVRYYKQNFTASYGNVNGVELSAAELAQLNNQHRYDSLHVPSNQQIGSQSAYGQTVTKETGYNRVHSQHTQSSSTRVDSKNERLEDFGEYGGYSQVNQHIPSISTQTVGTQHQVETAPGNWSKVDSYKTDGGHGQVFEEEGQYVTGPKKVHYFKKNFTSSYSSGSPQIGVHSARLDELHSELQRNLQKDLESLRRNYHQVSSSGHTASTQHVVSSVGLTQQEAGFHDLQTAESDGYRQNLGYHAPSTGSTYRYNEQQRETLTDTRPYPTADTYGTESQRTYQSHESHVSRVHPAPQSSHLSSGYVQVPRSDYQSSGYHSAHSSRHHLDETHRAETLGAHQSSVLQNQLLTDSQRVYNPHASHPTYPSRHGETSHYEEHWRSSSHGGSVVPERTITDYSAHDIGHTERAHYDRDAYNEHRARYHTLPARRYDSSAHTSGSSFDSAYRTSSGQLVTGSLDLGHAAHGADCTEETHQQYQHESRYHRKYKRDDHHGTVQEHQAIDKDFTQQNQKFDQETQQLEDLTQQNEQFTQQESDDLTQQTSGKLELGQQIIHNQHLNDLTQQSEQFTQQTEGRLEFGQQTVDNPHLEDLTQQTEGQLEFGQQTIHNPHPEDLTQQSEQFMQQTQGSDELTPQTSGKLEFGQQTIDNHHLDDLTQQSEQFTQQTEGQLEFGQQTIHPHPEDLIQQSEQFTQQTQGSDELTPQTSGKLEFGQQTIDNHHLDDLTQQSEQFTQQTEGQLEFGQQTIHNPHPEDLTQQSEQFTQQTQGSDELTPQTSGKLEFGQQTIDNHHLDDLTQQSEQFTQQTEGQLEFGQQTIHNPHPEDLTQQSEQFTQQTQGSDELTPQTSGKLEFGQQTIDNHHLDDLTQQSEQFTQQTEGQLEFGQQTIHNPHPEDLTQQSEQFMQQTQGSDELTPQTSGKLEFGQQLVDNPHLEDLTQQTQDSDDFTQQMSGKLEYEQQNDDTQLDKQLEQFTQQAAESDSLTQQRQVDKREFGQQVIDNKHLNNLTQQSEQFSQQTEGQLEFGQQILGNQHLEDSTGQNEQFAQQTVGSDDFTQQSGKLEFGQQMQSVEKLAKPKSQHLEEFNEENEDFTQQMGRFEDFTQQMGHLEFGQLHSKPKVGSHHLEDFTQQNKDITQQTGGFNDFSQQTAGHLEYGQQREQHQKLSWPEYNSQRLEHYSQQNEWNLDNLSQQSRQYPSYDNEQSKWQLEQMPQKTNFDQGFTQQATDLKPAPKPKLRPRYQKHDLIPSHTDIDRTDTIVDDVFKPVEVKPEAEIDNTHGRIIESGSRPTYPEFNHHTSKASYPTQESVFDNQKENMDWAHWVHKSNDATVGLQWHYTYHPSDLTNVEDSYDNSYPRHNVGSMSQQQTEDVQQHAKPFDFNQKETQNRDKLEDEYQNSYISQSQHNKYDQQSGSFQQTEMPRFDNQFNQDSGQSALRVHTLQGIQNDQLTSEQEKQSTPTTEQLDDKLEGRILQAYGGGPYDTPHTNDFYNRVKPNPSATLPPMDYDDPWDIREKPRELVRPRILPTVRNTPEIVTTTEAVETITEAIDTTTDQPSFWRRVGNKITNTYDKAKEKAKEIFG